jgi:hypothetical protein
MQPNEKRIGVLLADDAATIRRDVIRLSEVEPCVKYWVKPRTFPKPSS